MIKVKCIYGKDDAGNYLYHNESAYTLTDFPFKELTSVVHKGYITLPCTFDIESTTISDVKVPYAYMYIWQMCIEDKVVFGRTWNEWIELLDKLKDIYKLSEKRKLVIYVHNLSYEFEFIRDFIKFSNIFATDKRKVLKASNDYFEFRCSYYLSNMNLSKFIENTQGASHYKGIDDLDYRKVRTPADVLTDIEYGYCYNDVKGLYEAVLGLLQQDNLKTIPLTSTGYVRRDCRLSMRKNKHNRKIFINTQLDEEEYILMKECFRGGNTASNRYLTNQILTQVGSYDISSSYPYVMIGCKFPIGKFTYYSVETIDELYEINEKYYTIGRYAFVNLRVKNSVPIPYIPFNKCRNTINTVNYNGRVLSADNIQISLTNIDFDIINNQYEYDDLLVKDIYVSRKDYLPKEITNVIFEYFDKKSRLKNVAGEEYEYNKSKNKLNSIYGMTVTDPVHSDIIIDDSGEWITTQRDIQEELDKYYKSWNNFFPYQWGVFVTALARKRLQDAIDLVGMDVVYCDTDSVKYLGNHDFDFLLLNKEMEDFNLQHNIKYSIDIDGREYKLGVFESENKKNESYEYDEFKTLGAKKYAFNTDGKIGVTVAGLSKKLGAEELEKTGLKDFKIGKVFTRSGRTTAYFNNQPIHTITVNGVKIKTGSNIAIVDTTYTLGISDTMLNILEMVRGDLND